MIVINIKRILFFLLFYSFFYSITAQDVAFKNSNIKSDKKGLKSAIQDIKI